MTNPTTTPLTDEQLDEIEAKAAYLRDRLDRKNPWPSDNESHWMAEGWKSGTRNALDKLRPDLLVAGVRRLQQQRRFLIDQLAKKDAACGDGDRALTEFLGGEDEQPASVSVVPAWEAMYEPGNVSDYLIGYANDEAAAKGAAEAWLRSQKDEVGRLEWVPQRPLDGYDAEAELVERHADGVDTGPGIAVRRRAVAVSSV